MPIRNTLTIAFAAMFSLICYEKATRNRYVAMLSHAMEIIEDKYVEPVEPRQLFENAMKGMVNNLDEYSDYIGPEYFQTFQQTLDQEFVGIGVLVEGPPEVAEIRVVSPVYDSPAYRAGMRAGDVILEIDGESTAGLDLKQAIKRIKGLRGTTVQITVHHAGETEPVSMVVERDLIRTKSVLGDTRKPDGRWNYFLESDPRIGYIRLTTFGEHSVEELREVLRFADHPIKALIFDVRGNAGGLLDAAVAACDMFIDEGVIVSTRGRGGRMEHVFHAGADDTVFPKTIPIVVLADRYSASASEIVSACLKDHHRATIVGQRTWGKGTVQNVIPLEGGTSALKLTTASYWRPSGKNIHRSPKATEKDDWGVRPSKGCNVELTDEQYRALYEQRRARDVLSEQTKPSPSVDGDSQPAVDDPQLNRAVEVLQAALKAEAA